jgi:hypothetical protein
MDGPELACIYTVEILRAQIKRDNVEDHDLLLFFKIKIKKKKKIFLGVERES